MNSDTLLKQLNMFLTEANWFKAIYNKDIDIIKIFIEHKFDIDVIDCIGNTALINEVSNKNIDSIKLLLDAGANINYQNGTGWTSLIISVQNNDITLVKLLLDAGANMNIKDICGNTARMIAKEKMYINIIKLLNTHEKECSNTSKEYSSVMFSVKTSDLDSIIKSAIGYGAKSNFKIYDSDTALIIAKHFKQSIIKN